MSHGVSNVLTLYDQNGNPIQVKLVDNEYRLMTTDTRVADSLDDIKVLLTQLIELSQRV